MSKIIQGETPLVRICLKIIEWGTYIALLSPLVVSSKYYFPFVGPKGLFFMGAVEIVFAAWLILILHAKKYRPKLNIVLIAVLLYMLSVTLSSIFGISFENSFWSKFERMSGLLAHLHFLGFFLVLSSTFKEKFQWKKFFLVNVGVGLLISIISFISQASVKGLIFAARGGSTLGNSSFLGTYLLFCSFFAIYLFFNSKKNTKIFSMVSLVLMVISIWSNEARAATISFFGGVALIGLLYLVFVSGKKYLKIIGKALIIGGVILGIVLGSSVLKEGSFVQNKFIQLTTKSRLVVWDSALKGVGERPLLGWGPENFDFVFIKNFNSCMFLPECGGEIWFDRAHDIIVDTLVNVGIIGLLAYLFLFISVFLLLFKKYYKEKKISFWTFAIFSSLLVAYFVQNLTVFDMISSYIVFFLTLAFVSSLGNKEGEEVCHESKPFAIAFVLLLFIISFFSYIIGPAKAGKETIGAIIAKTADERLNGYKEALKASPIGAYQIREFFAQRTLDILRDPNQNFSTTQAKEELEFLIGELEKTRENNPLDFRNTMKLGELYGRLYFIEEDAIILAEERLEEAIRVSPTNQQGYWQLAQVKAFRNDYVSALELAKQAIALDPRVFDSHSIAIQIANAMGDTEEKDRLIQEAWKINESWLETINQTLNPIKIENQPID
jgi:O-antigen ligase/cytochrome c-type biogenesis protein CcmH/NrfG